MTIVIFVVKKETCSAKVLPNIRNIETDDIWLPRELGRFHLKDAGFIEVYETTPSLQTNTNQNATVYADKYNLYITTFNAGSLPIFTVTSNFITNIFPGDHSVKIFIKTYNHTFSRHVRSRSSLSNSISWKPHG